jgi:PAS domain S-box-containing protein
VGSGSVIGLLAFDSAEKREWSEPLQRRLQILAFVFAQALDRKHSEQNLRESGQRFRSVADAAPVLIWMSGTDKLCTYFNKPWLDFTGRSVEQELGNGWAEGIHAEDFQKCLDTYTQSFDRREKFRMEYRLRRHDGEYRWILDIGVPRFNQDRSFAGYTGIGVDVTDRKHAEDALRASEERLRLAQQAARIGTFEWNIQTGVNTWTPELEAMYGLSPGGFGGTQTAFENLVHPDDRAGVIELDNWALKTGQPTTGEWRVVWDDGSVHWIAGRWQVCMNESGQPSRMVGINIDITERRRAEQELATASERLHLAMESGSVGGWDYDVKTGKTVFFGMAHAQLGMSPDETSGSREEFWDHVHEDDRERYRSAIAAAREKKEHFDGEFRVVWRDGTIRWLRTRGRYYYAADGDPERLLGISVDITERRKAEQTLRESEQRLRLATQVGRMYAYDWDVTKDVVVRSSEHVKILGLTEPMHFLQQQFVDQIHPDDRPKFLAAIAGLTPENPTGEVTYRALASDRTLVWLKSNGRGFFDAEGRLLRVIGMVADVTDQKLAEEGLSEMSRKLMAAQEQERARIARELHDDINQRLAILALELEQLKENPSEVESRVQDLRKQTTDISNDVQALSHDLHSSQLEYLGAVAGMKSWCKEFGERQGMQVDCTYNVRSALPAETGLSLFRILQEALHNAAKHSGVKRIEVQLREDPGEIHLVIGDLGRGFDVEAASQGKGLGLTSMRERVRLVNGTISIESKPMRGTTIHVRVPLESEHAAKREAV